MSDHLAPIKEEASPDHFGGQRVMQCQTCGLTLDPQQVAQTGRCPRCGTAVVQTPQGFSPPQPAFQSGPPAGAGGFSDESPTVRVRPPAPEPAPAAPPPANPVDPYAATQRAPQPTPPASGPYGPPPGTASGPYGPPPGAAAQPPAYNPPPGGPDPFATAAEGLAAAPPAQPPYGAAPGFGGPPQPVYGGPPQQAFGPPPGDFSGPGQPPGYGSAPTYSGPGQPYGPPTSPFGAPPPAPRKSRTGLLIGVLIAVLLVGTLGSLTALGFAGKGPLSSLGPTPTPAATATPTATAVPTAAPTPNLPAGFQQFTSSDGTFSIAYPATWQQTTPTAGTGAQFSGPDGQQLIVLNAGQGQGDVATNEAAFCRSVGGPPSTPTTVTIGGQSWTQVECDNADATRHAAVDGITYKDSLYLIAYGASSDTFDQNRTSFFTPMEQSFQFLT